MSASDIRYLSKNDFSNLVDLIYDTVNCTDEEQYKCLIIRLRQLVPFDFATSGLAKIDQNGIKESFIIININYPSEWLDLYVKNHFNLIDPIVKKNFTKFEVQYWPDTYKQGQPPNEFLSSAIDFGLKTGYTHGTRNLKCTEGSLLSISGNSVEHSKRTEIVLKNLVPHLHLTLERLIKKRKENKVLALSKREKEILKWSASGKSNWEISVILSISERTIEFHMSNIMQKLDAVNKAHAVATALDIGLIDFD